MKDDEFLLRFEDRSLPLDLWNHRAHLKVAYLYLTRFSFAEALPRLRRGIQAYNAAHGIVDSQTSGYHETLTHAWLQLIHTALGQFGPAACADAFFDAQTQLSQKHTLLLFYSRDRVMSLEAKASFILPDLAPLPQPLPTTSRISRIILFVKDVPKVAAFYQRHFGLEPIGSKEDRWLELAAGGCNLALHRTPTTSRERGRSPAKIVFAVADVHAAKQRFAANGLRFGKVHEVGGFAFANARDPEGNPIQISSRGIPQATPSGNPKSGL